MSTETEFTNELGQSVNYPVEHWQATIAPAKTPMVGRFCELIPFDLEAHAQSLFESYDIDNHKEDWSYLLGDPPKDFSAFYRYVEHLCTKDDPLFFTVMDRSTKAFVGIASYLRINPTFGVIEVGHINFSHLIQRSPMATEAMYMMMYQVFEELNYRRYEWKTDSFNKRSRSAATRLGFTFEGIFRQAIVYKNRNRDTAWYSIIDSEWPALKKVYSSWFDSSNFDNEGNQIKSLRTLVSEIN